MNAKLILMNTNKKETVAVANNGAVAFLFLVLKLSCRCLKTVGKR